MLPSEVIALIFEELSDFDFVMFAITNSQLFAIAYTQYVARVAEFRAPWAFDRIILVGDESSDLPDTFLSEAEHTALFDSSDEDRLYKIAEATFECMSQRCFLDDSVRLRQLSTNFGRREDYYNAVSLTTGMSLLFTTIRPRVLINVSTNEYIRQTKATPFNGILPLLAAYGYPDGRRYEEDPCYGSQRGPWAGHQLAVVSQEDHQKMMQADEEPWEDITEVIAGS
ncbi:hypothetical protein ONZ45_g9632 [Pleurotus djamor]|nr:hypothetical protein ONZ45_g9632 [Pleurotus djamor]